MNERTRNQIRSILDDPDLFTERCRRRLKQDLGLHDEAIDVIINLRSQVLALQAELLELESVLESYQGDFNTRISLYLQAPADADWKDD